MCSEGVEAVQLQTFLVDVNILTEENLDECYKDLITHSNADLRSSLDLEPVKLAQLI